MLTVLALGPGCGEVAPKESVREGLDLKVAGVDYNVLITRQLNLRDAEDRDYFKGPAAAPGATYYGVFLSACNPAGPPVQAASTFRIVDTQGAEFEPMEIDPDNPFAYRARRLGAEECIPAAGSTADSGPTGGALLVFELPVAAGENRPLELEIIPPGGGGDEIASVELDI